MPDPNRYSTWFGDNFVEWDIWSSGPFPFIDLRYFAHVFRAFDQLLRDRGLHVIATDAVTGALPVAGDNVIVLCLNDEFGRSPSYAFDVRLVVKTMGGGSRPPYVALWPPRFWPGLPVVGAQEVLVQLRRLPSLLRVLLGSARHGQRPPLLPVPLGIRAFHDRPLVPFADREFDVMFAGSLVNEPGEDLRRLPTQKVRFRQDFLRALNAAQAARPDVRFSIRTVGSHWSAVQKMGEYLDEMSQSRLVLCPRGSSLDTHRFFEALRFGCVPIYEKQPRGGFYEGSPAVCCKDWARLPRVIDQLLGDRAGLELRHKAALEWYDQHVSPPAVGKMIADAVEKP
ncbi:MAG: hypothetical protein QOG53_1952 [Frankiales bacterium]|nr:hypothetical protein [Frankiales bacterium]